jgi:galactokinase
LPAEVRKRSQFIIEEHARVLEMAEALSYNQHNAILRITAASFTGARDLFEVSVPAMQAMFDAMNSAPGRIGCRQAGAGFGGCMVRSTTIGRFCHKRSRALPSSHRNHTRRVFRQDRGWRGTSKLILNPGSRP